MKRSVSILAGILVLGLIAYQVAFRLSYAEVASMEDQSDAELEWLRHEFPMTDNQFEEISALHAQHDEECLTHCQQLSAINLELRDQMRESVEVTSKIESLLQQTAAIQEVCRRTTLQHIYRVSQHMDPEVGERYRIAMTEQLVDVPWHTQIQPGEAAHSHH